MTQLSPVCGLPETVHPSKEAADLAQEHYRILKGLAILVALQWLGNLLAERLGVLPGTLYGLLLLLVALISKIIPLDDVETAAQLLLDNLAVFFIPSAVGVMLLKDLLIRQWLPIVGTIVLGTVTVMMITGWVVQLVTKGSKQHDQY